MVIPRAFGICWEQSLLNQPHERPLSTSRLLSVANYSRLTKILLKQGNTGHCLIKKQWWGFLVQDVISASVAQVSFLTAVLNDLIVLSPTLTYVVGRYSLVQLVWRVCCCIHRKSLRVLTAKLYRVISYLGGVWFLSVRTNCVPALDRRLGSHLLIYVLNNIRIDGLFILKCPVTNSLPKLYMQLHY